MSKKLKIYLMLSLCNMEVEDRAEVFFSFGCHEWSQIYAKLDFRVSNLANLIVTLCFP